MARTRTIVALHRSLELDRAGARAWPRAERPRAPWLEYQAYEAERRAVARRPRAAGREFWMAFFGSALVCSILLWVVL